MLLNRKVFITHPDLIPVVYPTFRPIKSVYDASRGMDVIIYGAKETESGMFCRMLPPLGCRYIVTVTNNRDADIILSDRTQYLKEVAEATPLMIPKTLEKKVLRLTDGDFWHFLKTSYALKKWNGQVFEKREKAYHLFQALFEGRRQFMTIYFEMRKTMSCGEIFSSMVTFLSRMRGFEEQKGTLSDFYRALIGKGREQLKNINPAISNLVSMSRDIPLEMRLLEFYFSIRGE
jgi:hypothetical protein